MVFLRALPNLRFPIGRDQATYSVIGQGLLRGQLLYRDLWDDKPPGIFYIYALIVRIFGPVMWSVGVVDILWLLAISLCIFYFARRYMGVPAASLAMVANAVRHCRQGYIHAAQPETFMMLCIFGAWFLLSGSDPLPPVEPQGPRPEGSGQAPTWWMARYAAAGVILGGAFWLKYNAVAFFPFVALAPFLDFRDVDTDARRVRLTLPWKAWIARMIPVAAAFYS